MNIKLINLQAARGIAAMLVVFFHLALAEKKLWPESDVHFFSVFEYFGFAGVDLFFVISGFVITWVSYESIGCKDKISGFLVRRGLRIYPVYWVLCGLIYLSVVFEVGINGALDNVSFFKAVRELLLFPSGHQAFVPVSWSLTFEMYFYFVFALIMVFPKKHFLRALVLWSIGVMGLIYFSEYFPSGKYAFFDLVSDPLALEFVLGCSAALLIKRGFLTRPLWSGGIGVALLLLGAWAGYSGRLHLDNHGLVRVLFFGSASFLLIYSLCVAEIRHGIHLPAIFQRLGNASYSIYLVHLTAYSLVRKFTNSIEVPFSSSYGYWHQIGWDLFMLVAGVLAGFLLYIIAERPLLSASKYILSRRSSQLQGVARDYSA